MEFNHIVPAEFTKNLVELKWNPSSIKSNIPFRKTEGWQSHGGNYNNHLCKTNPKSLVIDIDSNATRIKRIYLVGIFALWPNLDESKHLLPGAVISGTKNKVDLFQIELFHHIHYVDSTLYPINGVRINGDGTSLEQLDTVYWHMHQHRLDLLTIDLLDHPVEIDKLSFIVLSQSTSFILFDVFTEFDHSSRCPFHSPENNLVLSEVSSYIRLGDKIKFDLCVSELLKGIQKIGGSDIDTQLLDEAKGSALTFIALINSALLELGAPRSIHRNQLEIARQLDNLNQISDIIQYTQKIIEQLTKHLFHKNYLTGDPIIDKCLKYLERMYSQDLDDDKMASYLDLSTSHFRFLFKKAIGKPFGQYLNAYRLEKARSLIINSNLSISDICSITGYSTMGNFCRAFKQRFQVPATTLREKSEINRLS